MEPWVPNCIPIVVLQSGAQAKATILPRTEDRMSCEMPNMKYGLLRCLHNANILEAEYDPKLQMEEMLVGEVIDDVSCKDEVGDMSVSYVMSLLEKKACFTQKLWKGGYDILNVLIAETKNTSKTTKGKGKGRKLRGARSKKGKEPAVEEENETKLTKVDERNLTEVIKKR